MRTIFASKVKDQTILETQANQWYSSFTCSSLIKCKEGGFLSYLGQQKLPLQILFYSYTSSFFYVYSYTSKLCKFTFIFKTNLKKKIYIQKSIKPNQWYSSSICSSLISCKEEEFFSYVGQQKLPKVPTWFNPQPLKQKLSTQILFYSYTFKPGK